MNRERLGLPCSSRVPDETGMYGGEDDDGILHVRRGVCWHFAAAPPRDGDGQGDDDDRCARFLADNRRARQHGFVCRFGLRALLYPSGKQLH